MSKTARLKALLQSGETLVMPDAYDPISARLIERLGFAAVQCSGFSMALAACWPTEADFSREQNLAVTAAICEAVTVPVMADAEDGFGGVGEIPETVRLYAAAGVAGMNIEDQVLREPGPKRVLPREVALEKIEAARAAAIVAGVPDLVINARTDALAVDPEGGLDEAIVRGNLYLAAGADLVFVVGVATLEQVQALVAGLKGPLSIAAGMPYNLTTLSVADLRAAGVARVSLPSLMIFSALKAMRRSLESVRDTDGFTEIAAQDWTCGMAEVPWLLKG